jgi:hypothetical protein
MSFLGLALDLCKISERPKRHIHRIPDDDVLKQKKYNTDSSAIDNPCL